MERAGGITERRKDKVHRRVKASPSTLSNHLVVSNIWNSFNKEQLQELLAHATVKPVVNQILLHPYVITQTAPLLEYLKEQNIVPEGYSTLIPLTSRPGGPVDKPVKQIAKRLNVNPEQVLLAWSRAKGYVFYHLEIGVE